MRKSRMKENISNCIGAYLKEYRKRSHLDNEYGDIYYWNERDIQCDLYSYLRENSTSYGIGSRWRVHAEGIIKRPRYARRKKWPGKRRADIVIIDHREYKKTWGHMDEDDVPEYLAMIELKLIWKGDGKAYGLDGVERDMKQLRQCLAGTSTTHAFLILFDGINRKRLPYWDSTSLKELKAESEVAIFHWPDSEEPISNPRECNWREY